MIDRAPIRGLFHLPPITATDEGIQRQLFWIYTLLKAHPTVENLRTSEPDQPPRVLIVFCETFRFLTEAHMSEEDWAAVMACKDLRVTAIRSYNFEVKIYSGEEEIVKALFITNSGFPQATMDKTVPVRRVGETWVALESILAVTNLFEHFMIPHGLPQDQVRHTNRKHKFFSGFVMELMSITKPSVGDFWAELGSDISEAQFYAGFLPNVQGLYIRLELDDNPLLTFKFFSKVPRPAAVTNEGTATPPAEPTPVEKESTSMKVAPERIDAIMQSLQYQHHHFPGTNLTVAVSKDRNGFVYEIGTSSVLESKDFDPAEGVTRAVSDCMAKTRAKLWEMESYALYCSEYRAKP